MSEIWRRFASQPRSGTRLCTVHGRRLSTRSSLTSPSSRTNCCRSVRQAMAIYDSRLVLGCGDCLLVHVCAAVAALSRRGHRTFRRRAQVGGSALAATEADEVGTCGRRHVAPMKWCCLSERRSWSSHMRSSARSAMNTGAATAACNAEWMMERCGLRELPSRRAEAEAVLAVT